MLLIEITVRVLQTRRRKTHTHSSLQCSVTGVVTHMGHYRRRKQEPWEVELGVRI